MSNYMRLLHVDEHDELSLTKHVRDEIPPYAILSHTWGADGDEVVYEDIQNGNWRNRKGKVKIDFCIERIKQRALKHFWIDTCCINKSDREELAFVITSMFQWYAKSAVCYVFLCDVSSHKRSLDGSHDPWRSALRRAKWFTRGWTLQELLAPKSVEFYSLEGCFLGDKSSLEQDIYDTTRISRQALRGANLSTFTPEERMSWAKNRETTREEDEAYCLSGIFEVYLIPHYGEGQYAFVRLKREIAQASGEQIMTISSPMRPRNSIMDSRSPEWPCSTERGSSITERRTALLESLQFDQMDSRQETLKNAYRKTCEWLLSHPYYVGWMDTKNRHDHNGFLWLSGNPGVGKSTMMKFAFANAKKTNQQNDLALAFFFNARGDALEKSTVGMYRAILWHMFQHAPDLQHLLDDVDTQNWTVDALTQLLFAAVAKLGQRRFCCFIDALDECDEEQVREMITAMEDLSMHATQSGARFNICFASRHYPTIAIRYGRQIVLEAEPGHDEDITKYIKSHLRGRSGHAVEDIKTELHKKANGVFLWVVLVIQILNETLTRGQVKQAKKALGEIPEQLGQLFRRIILRDRIGIPELLLSLQLILFAARPLTREEFYHVIETWHDEDSASIKPLDLSEATEEHMKWFVSSSSKGLAELTKSKRPTIQFIHESVRDYLIRDDGLRELWPEIGEALTELSHDQLKQCCAKYLQADLSANTEQGQPLPKAKSDEGRRLRENVTKSFPFLEYACKYIWHHAEEAQSSFRPPTDFLSYRLNRWIDASNILQVHTKRRLTARASLLYVLSENNCPNLIDTLPHNHFRNNDRAERYRHPVFAALTTGSEATVLALLNRWTRQTAIDTPPWGGAEVDFSIIRDTDEDGATALYRASEKGWKDTVQLLLRHGADTEARRKNDSTSLGVAVANSHMPVAQILVQSGANVNAKQGHDENCLVSAVRRNQQEMVRILLKTDGDVDMQDALYLTVSQGQQEMVQILLEAGANVNAQPLTYKNPLRAAVWQGQKEIVQMLLEAGADVNAQGGLYAAVDQDQMEMVQMLLEAGAGVNTPGALYSAVCRGHKEIVQMLLKAGADVNAQARAKPLEAAIQSGERDMVRILLEAGADFNARNDDHRNALEEAAYRGQEEILEMLWEAGADVKSQEGSHANGRQAAVCEDEKQVV